jgi:hypothetical protein
MIHRIVSGGQTGVDRAALEAAAAFKLDYGGWCPKGRLAEDGAIPKQYAFLQETDSSNYSERTERNVQDSDGTLILYSQVLLGGTKLTLELAKMHKKPVFLVDLGSQVGAERVVKWAATNNIHVLNCAGPRESECPGINEQSRRFLMEVIGLATKH